MPTITYFLIETATVGSGGAANITFSSIPQTYTDLVLKLSTRDDRASQTLSDLRINFNNTATNLFDQRLYGNGTTQSADVSASSLGRIGVETASTALASTFGNIELHIPDYASSSVNKRWIASAVSENNVTLSFIQYTAGIWSNTSAITSIKLFAESSANLVQYSVASLYGIKKQ